MLIIDREYVIAASTATVWQAMNDPAVLRHSIRGIERVDRVSADEFLIGARLRIGPVSSSYRVCLRVREVDVPRRYSLRGEGCGGLAEAAHGGADVELVPHPRGTVLRYKARVQTGSRLADVALPLLRGVARRMSDRFFARFASAVVVWEAAHEPPVHDTDGSGRADKTSDNSAAPG